MITGVTQQLVRAAYFQAPAPDLLIWGGRGWGGFSWTLFLWWCRCWATLEITNLQPRGTSENIKMAAEPKAPWGAILLVCLAPVGTMRPNGVEGSKSVHQNGLEGLLKYTLLGSIPWSVWPTRSGVAPEALHFLISLQVMLVLPLWGPQFWAKCVSLKGTQLCFLALTSQSVALHADSVLASWASFSNPETVASVLKMWPETLWRRNKILRSWI